MVSVSHSCQFSSNTIITILLSSISFPVNFLSVKTEIPSTSLTMFKPNSHWTEVVDLTDSEEEEVIKADEMVLPVTSAVQDSTSELPCCSKSIKREIPATILTKFKPNFQSNEVVVLSDSEEDARKDVQQVTTPMADPTSQQMVRRLFSVGSSITILTSLSSSLILLTPTSADHRRDLVFTDTIVFKLQFFTVELGSDSNVGGGVPSYWLPTFYWPSAKHIGDLTFTQFQQLQFLYSEIGWRLKVVGTSKDHCWWEIDQ